MSPDTAAPQKRKKAGPSGEVGGGKNEDIKAEGGEEEVIKATAHLIQLGHYAAEFLSRGPYVTHNIGIKVNRKCTTFPR